MAADPGADLVQPPRCAAAAGSLAGAVAGGGHGILEPGPILLQDQPLTAKVDNNPWHVW